MQLPIVAHILLVLPQENHVRRVTRIDLLAIAVVYLRHKGGVSVILNIVNLSKCMMSVALHTLGKLIIYLRAE